MRTVKQSSVVRETENGEEGEEEAAEFGEEDLFHQQVEAPRWHTGTHTRTRTPTRADAHVSAPRQVPGRCSRCSVWAKLAVAGSWHRPGLAPTGGPHAHRPPTLPRGGLWGEYPCLLALAPCVDLRVLARESLGVGC